MRNNLPVIKNNHHKLKCEFDKIGRIVISKNTNTSQDKVTLALKELFIRNLLPL